MAVQEPAEGDRLCCTDGHQVSNPAGLEGWLPRRPPPPTRPEQCSLVFVSSRPALTAPPHPTRDGRHFRQLDTGSEGAFPSWKGADVTDTVSFPPRACG